MPTPSVSPDAPAVEFPAPLPYDHPTVALLVEQHGPLIPHDAVAALLGRNPQGLRDMISRRPDDHAYEILRAARRPVGRRVLYDARIFALLIAGEVDS